MDPPPILPDIEEQLRDYLICPEKLPIYDYRTNQEFWARDADPTSLFHFEGSPLCTTLRVQRDPDTGKILQFNEVPIQTVGANAQNSMSFNRQPLAPEEATLGSALNIPFWPGGFPDPVSKLNQKNEDTLDNNELLTVPPGFERGLHFEADGSTVSSDSTGIKGPAFNSGENVVNLMDIIKQEKDFLDIWVKDDKKKEKVEDEKIEPLSIPEEEEFILPDEAPVVNISDRIVPPNMKDTEWAILLDCSKPIHNFEEHVPNMAHTFKFELDTFQKLAIMHLEQHNHVFVAAHTSAGKTVVAEYAIALSKKHMTRTIYTSPIKALSNQKYRDFRRIFKDVGLITGDFQINQTAACLIMTTEILRSMLYNGSDVARDLEYVIFDEVHYVNDAERGHVWEQVLILLPAHVTIIMLSATAPNTIEFADWLGRTKQKKVYVVSTSKRPVPLHHYLYTGTGGDSKDKRFLVLDPKGWHQDGFMKALASVEESPRNQSQHNKLNANQQKTMWCALIDHLNKKQLLPVVAFTFSRAFCHKNAMSLTHLDLTTQKEKSQIKKLFDDCIKSLKEPDRLLPQIITMRALLIQGIGVHHSGILPLIKEVVELLFQNNLVKLLFATETFAMGVNMPARTVVFNWVYKHDGQKTRLLLPAEYIQMAGRAGRRGLDKEGTVIILCNKKLPSHSELREMMTGRPSQLQSQFRLTYGMVLSLLRVESLSVEGMMSRSFREADHQKQMFDIRNKLKDIEEQLSSECTTELSDYMQPLIKFYAKASEYLETRATHMISIMTNHKVTREITPGRVLLITHKHHINKLAVFLTFGKSTKSDINYKVLVLTEDKPLPENEANLPDTWFKMISLAKEKIFCPFGAGSHDVLTINQNDIWEICDIIFKVNAPMILKDWENRQIPRFKNDPPGPSCNAAIQDLLKLTMAMMGKNKMNCGIKYLHFLHDLKINNHDLYENIKLLQALKEKTESQVDNIQIPNFEDQFRTVFKKKYLEDQRDQMQFQLSHASMTLYPDYENRIKLLKKLNYVSEDNRVQLKGRVACEMGMNELMITEIVFRNILNKLKPAEVAALMSALVFQAKTEVEIDFDELPNDLLEAKLEIEKVFNQIQALECEFQVCNDIGRDEELNFGLIQVVYQWASDKPFSQIMFLTDVEEGLIVRCIQQLNDTICDVRNASRLIGDPELLTKMEEVSNAIKRDIVFAPSLYTQQEIHLMPTV